jgi:hypothetical protein
VPYDVRSVVRILRVKEKEKLWNTVEPPFKVCLGDGILYLESRNFLNVGYMKFEQKIIL